MEEQIITVTIRTRGDKCEMRDAEIKAWYKMKIAGLINPAYGTPELSVQVERREQSYSRTQK